MNQASPQLVRMAEQIATMTKSEGDLKFAFHASGDVYLNLYDHRGGGITTDQFTGKEASHNAFMDASDCDWDAEANNGAMRYRTTIVLHPDGTWTTKHLKANRDQ